MAISRVLRADTRDGSRTMYSLFRWYDQHYHPSGWVKLCVFAFFVIAWLAKAADKKRPDTGPTFTTGRRPEPDGVTRTATSAAQFRAGLPGGSVAHSSAVQPTSVSTMSMCGILSLVISLIGTVVLYGPCGIAAVILGVIGVVGGRGAGVKAASVVGIVIGTIEILLFGFLLLMLWSSTQ